MEFRQNTAMSTTELKEKLRVLPRAERREMMEVLMELEAAETEAPVLVPAKRSFEEAMAYTFQNFDNALQKLAQ
jgi:hypothetical protein